MEVRSCHSSTQNPQGLAVSFRGKAQVLSMDHQAQGTLTPAPTLPPPACGPSSSAHVLQPVPSSLLPARLAHSSLRVSALAVPSAKNTSQIVHALPPHFISISAHTSPPQSPWALLPKTEARHPLGFTSCWHISPVLTDLSVGSLSLELRPP